MIKKFFHRHWPDILVFSILIIFVLILILADKKGV